MAIDTSQPKLWREQVAVLQNERWEEEDRGEVVTATVTLTMLSDPLHAVAARVLC
jgi:hypothetical protein